MGKRRDARTAAVMTEVLEKAGLGGTPMQSSTATIIPGNSIAVPGSMPSLAQALQRDVATFGSQMGPNYPPVPFALDPLNRNGRPDPRKYDYDIAWNLQISRELAKWTILKAAAEQCDIVARAITIRASEVAKMDKSWIVSDEEIARIVDRDGVGTAEGATIARQENEELISSLNEQWDNPYPQSDRGWREWITEAIWQIMVNDGLAIHPAMTLGGDCQGLNIIDASTIKCLLNNYGDTPRPPDPAYQQVLKGFPRGEFTATPDKDGKTTFLVDAQYKTDERDQLSYFVMNRRTWTPYGFSPVEQSIPLVNLYLEYQKMMLFEFKHGTSSDVYMKTTGDAITLANINNWERIYNDYLEGDTANRKKTRLLPDGMDPIFAPTIEERFKPDYIESVLKRLAGIFGISSQQLGVIPRAGMGGGKGAQEGDADNAETVSAKPMMNFIEEMVVSCSRRYYGATKAVTFVLTDDKGGQSDVEIAKAAQTDVQSGVMTLNEVRRDRGMSDYEFEGADKPYVLAGNAVIYLEEAYKASIAPPEAPNDQASPQEGPQGPQSTQGAQPESPQGPSGGEAGATELAKETEVKAYRRFKASGKSREFVFKSHTPDEVEVLKATLGENLKGSSRTSEDNPDHAKLTSLASKHAKALHVALVGGVSGIATAIAQALRNVATSDLSIARGISATAVAQHVTFDNLNASTVLGQIYHDAANLANKTASDALGSEVAQSRSTIELLQQRNITLKGINDSSMKRISDAIAQGISNGQSGRTIGDAVNAVIANPQRADVIAITESNRSYNGSFVDQLQAAGETTFDWVNDADPCPDCEAELGSHPIDDAPPPLHPACRCSCVMSDGSTSSE